MLETDRSPRRPQSPPRWRIAHALLAGALLLATSAPPGAAWPGLSGEGRGSGILLEVDRQSYELVARDLRDGTAGPRLPIATGSPTYPTPPGEYRIHRLIRNPAWRPGVVARSRGGTPSEPSPDGPMGIAKLPFRSDGLALHGGAGFRLLGKPITLGCVRTSDGNLSRLIGWLEARGALGEAFATGEGELHQDLRVALRIRIH